VSCACSKHTFAKTKAAQSAQPCTAKHLSSTYDLRGCGVLKSRVDGDTPEVVDRPVTAAKVFVAAC
jgi:hypothetical protein